MIKNHTSIEVKEMIRDRINIASVIGRYVTLQKSGVNHKGICPFHKEKTPSFLVRVDKALYYCFGCAKGGDVFTFLMEIEGIEFPEALRRLAEEAGLSHLLGKATETTGAAVPLLSKTETFKINNLAARFYYDQMKKSEEAISFFKSRNLSGETVKHFRLGFASKEWYNLTTHLSTRGITHDQLCACGLAVASKQGGTAYDRFRNRIIFPIFAMSGDVIGFGGRVLDSNSLPKYLNSPDTLVYQKNRNLYGLFQSRSALKESGCAYIVEGYIDYLALYQAGIQNVVATSGTALTLEHGHLLKRFISKVILVFDGDDAGIAAAQRAVMNLASVEMSVKVMLLPRGHDPDTFIVEQGKDEFLRRSQNGLDGFAFLVKLGMEKHDISIPFGKSAIVDFCLPYLSSVRDSIVVGELVKHLAETLEIHERLIYEKIGKNRDQQISLDVSSGMVASVQSYLHSEEGSFWHMIIRQPSLIKEVENYISEETFSDTFSKNLYSIILSEYQRYNSLQNIILKINDPQLKSVVSAMMLSDVPTENSKEEIIHKVKRTLIRYYKQRKQQITKLLRQETDYTKRMSLLRQQQLIITQQGELVKE